MSTVRLGCYIPQSESWRWTNMAAYRLHTSVRTCISLSSQVWMLLKDSQFSITPILSAHGNWSCVAKSICNRLSNSTRISTNYMKYLVCPAVWLLKPTEQKMPARFMCTSKARKLWVTSPKGDKQYYKSTSNSGCLNHLSLKPNSLKPHHNAERVQNVPLAVQCFLEPGVITSIHTPSLQIANIKWLRTKCYHCTTQPPLTGPSEGSLFKAKYNTF